MKHPILKTTPEISERMGRVHLKGGKAEELLAKALWHNGIRYQKNYKKLFGSPDIAITKQKIAIFVDGEFWHGYNWEVQKDKLKSNRTYWITKIEENIERDKRNDKLLVQDGWKVYHFWEKQILKDLDSCMYTILKVISAK
ncbi:very short patch repair endonuclease [Caproicibacter sp.]|uniref:very short patch repair endonuclease n=1 Tax=Caproicibacter sp. TaxID=2814884 RepID=UPI003988E186